MRRKSKITAFGRQMKIKMIEKSMTSKELANQISMAESTICDVIFGRNRGQRIKRMIAEQLGIDELV